MQIKLHLPRRSEAEIEPEQKQDLIITPKFYKRSGSVTFCYLTTVDSNGQEEYYMMTISASSKRLHIEKLVEVVPSCDETHAHRKAREKKDAESKDLVTTTPVE